MSEHDENSKVAGTKSSRDDNAEMASIEDRLPELARRAVETFVREGRVLEVPCVSAASLLGQRAACFVSIKFGEGNLRGCIGTVEPVKATLAGELITNAISAATRDPRFSPITISELSQVQYSVDVLSPPEPTRFEELNPKTYGLIVEDKQGRRGLLLPNLAGVKTAAQQLQIAARKAGILSGVRVKLYRFRVRHYGE